MKILFTILMLITINATAQKKPTLTQRVTALEKANLKSRSAVTTDRLFAEYKVMQVRFDSVMRELAIIKTVQKRASLDTVMYVKEMIVKKITYQ